MPYEVKSHCEACQEGDEFVIGLWPKHLGVFMCGACRKVVNVPLDGETCPGCGYPPAVEEFYDYSGAIPYLGGTSLGPLEPGPECPKCGQGRLSFETTSHINVGPLGTPEDGKTPWVGRDYLEKAIFVYSLLPVCSEFELPPDAVLKHYNLDVPKTLIAARRVSFPIMLDVRSHLLALARAGEADFPATPKLQAAINQELGVLLDAVKPRKRWWQFWKS